MGSVLGRGQGLSLNFWKTLAGRQSQVTPHGQEWGGNSCGRSTCHRTLFHALSTQVQKKNMLLADKSVENQVLMLSVGFAKQTNK